MADTYTLISSVTVGAGGASSIDFTSIPATYTDLLIKFSGRTNRTGTGGDGVGITLNGVVVSYDDKFLRGNGSTAASYSDTSAANIYGGRLNTAGTTSSTFSNMEIYIPNYTSSNKKSISIDAVEENNGTEAYAELIAGLSNTVTSAITSISLFTSYTLQQYSTAYLYGIKNS